MQAVIRSNFFHDLDFSTFITESSGRAVFIIMLGTFSESLSVFSSTKGNFGQVLRGVNNTSGPLIIRSKSLCKHSFEIKSALLFFALGRYSHTLTGCNSCISITLFLTNGLYLKAADLIHDKTVVLSVINIFSFMTSFISVFEKAVSAEYANRESVNAPQISERGTVVPFIGFTLPLAPTNLTSIIDSSLSYHRKYNVQP